MRPVARALITHGHSDHARPGHGAVLATRQTLDIMALRYGEGGSAQRGGDVLRVVEADEEADVHESVGPVAEGVHFAANGLPHRGYLVGGRDLVDLSRIHHDPLPIGVVARRLLGSESGRQGRVRDCSRRWLRLEVR